MPTQGIDLSANNPHPVDFDAVLKSGRSFVIVKLTEGGGATGYVNPEAAGDIKAAKAAGLQVAGYHFVHPTVPVAEQVALIEEHLDVDHKPDESVAFVWVDSELAESTWGATASVTKAMCEALAAKGVKVGLYSNLNFLDNMEGAPWGYPLWLAEYGPHAGHAFTIWQFTQSGGCHGVVGAVDISLYPGTPVELHALFTK